MEMTEEAKEARREYIREWKRRNPDKVRQHTRAYRRKNPDKVKEWNRQYWERRAARD